MPKSLGERKAIFVLIVGGFRDAHIELKNVISRLGLWRSLDDRDVGPSARLNFNISRHIFQGLRFSFI